MQKNRTSVLKSLPLMLCLLALLLSAFALAGCSGGGEGGGTQDSGTQDSGTGTTDAGGDSATAGSLALVDGDSVARVVVRFNPTVAEQSAAESIAAMLTKKSGKTVSVSTADTKTYDANAVEILVGEVDYPEVTAVRSKLALGSTTVRVEGNKVVVFARMDDWYSSCAKKLVQLIFSQEAGSVQIARDFDGTVVCNETINAAPIVEGFLPDDVNMTGVGETCVDLFYEKKTASDFDTFCTGLEAQGWIKYASHQIGDNKYATYTNETDVLNVSIVPYRNRLTVALESKEDTDLQGLQSDNVYTSKNLDSTITQLGMWIGYSDSDRWDAWINGLGHVIRLDDGSFIIIDGGHDRTMNEEQLYNTLAIQAPDPDNIVIAAWIFTHPHGDHTGAFSLFDHANVTVEQFIIHLPSVTAEKSAGGGTSSNTYLRIREKYPNAKVVTAHPGQVFYIRNAEIEMLWTLDMLYGKDFVEVNAASLCFNLTLNGHKILYLGDQTNAETNKMVRAFGKLLQAETMLTPHHAFNGTELLWATVAPKYVWCDSGSVWQFDNSLGTMNGNNYFWKNDKITTWFAADHVWVVTFKENQDPSAQYYENIKAFYEAMNFTPSTSNS